MHRRMISAVARVRVVVAWGHRAHRREEPTQWGAATDMRLTERVWQDSTNALCIWELAAS